MELLGVLNLIFSIIHEFQFLVCCNFIVISFYLLFFILHTTPQGLSFKLFMVYK